MLLLSPSPSVLVQHEQHLNKFIANSVPLNAETSVNRTVVSYGNVAILDVTFKIG